MHFNLDYTPPVHPPISSNGMFKIGLHQPCLALVVLIVSLVVSEECLIIYNPDTISLEDGLGIQLALVLNLS